MSSASEDIGAWQKVKSKTMQNPMLFPAAGLTAIAIGQMFRSLLKRDSVGFQKSQRLRVVSGFQALAFTAFGLGLWYKSLPIDSAEKEAKEAFEAKEIADREERYKNLK